MLIRNIIQNKYVYAIQIPICTKLKLMPVHYGVLLIANFTVTNGIHVSSRYVKYVYVTSKPHESVTLCSVRLFNFNLT